MPSDQLTMLENSASDDDVAVKLFTAKSDLEPQPVGCAVRTLVEPRVRIQRAHSAPYTSTVAATKQRLPNESRLHILPQ